MTDFLLISAAMLGVALVLLAPALLRKPKVSGSNNTEHNIRIARERLSELESAHQQGELSDEEFNQAREDLEIALAQDLSLAEQSALNADQNTGRITLMALVFLIPLSVYLFYQETGAPQHLAVSGPSSPAPAATPAQLPPIEELVAKLEERLDADPQNPEGWYLLGRTYMRMERYDDAVRTFKRLNELLPNQPQAMLALADALSMQNQGLINQSAVDLLQALLKIEPQNATALWLLGQHEVQQGNKEKALSYWQQALPLLGDNPELVAELRNRIAILGGEVPESTPAPAPTQTPVRTEGDGVLVQVALDPSLIEQAPDDATVFIYAKAVSGPPMPLAVSRHRVNELPVEVRLTDGMAMMPQMKLSNFKQVLVGARISRSGQAIAQAGDLQSAEVQVDSKDGQAKLLINSQR